MSDASQRRGYLDWMRGLAVLIMIEAHTLDSWMRVDVRDGTPFRWAMIVAGFGAPLFLFLAGVTVALSAGSKLRRTGDVGTAATTVMRRGLWVFGLAFLFRVQAWVLGMGSPKALLKVDILNVMGPSIAAAAALWGAFSTPRGRVLAFGAVTLAIGLLTPIVRLTPLLDPLPDPLEAYLRPIRGLTSFCIFPWAGFLFAGALAGVLLDGVRDRDVETRLQLRFFAGGAALALGAYAASYLPSPYARSEFWGSSPAFFLLRVGVVTAAVPLAYAWSFRPTLLTGWSPLQQLGRSSLFIYWIHVEMVYGLISVPLHKSLSLWGACTALVAFGAFMLLCSIVKELVVDWWSRRTPPSESLLTNP
jgi:uncharacterized membrane protein